MNRRILTLLLALLPVLAFVPEPLNARETSLTILFTSDHHGQLAPSGNGKGGVARRKTLIDQVRAEIGTNRVVLLDAGDVFTGSALSGLTRGEADAAAYQLMGYDAVLLGNHDFDYGKDAIRAASRNFRMPWLSTNTVDRSTSQNFVRAYVFRMAGLRVGIIGLSNPETPNITAKGNTRGIAFNPPHATVKGMRTLLKKESSVFVVLSHLGLDEDRRLAKSEPYLHVIIGGHDHQTLQEPIVEKSKDGSPAGPLICHSGPRGEYLGRLDLTLDGTKKDGFRVVRYQYQLIPVDGSIVPDPAMESLLSKYAEKVDLAHMEESVAVATTDLIRDSGGDHAVGQLAADALRRVAKADAALLNSGTFRTDWYQGPLTRASVYEMMPFDDQWVVRTMTGAQLARTLQRSFEVRGSGAFLQVSGLTVRKTGKGRKASLEIAVAGQPLDATRSYRVALNDYLANGGDGYVGLRALRAPALVPGEDAIPAVGTSLREVFLEALRQRGRLSSKDVEKRWQLEP